VTLKGRLSRIRNFEVPIWHLKLSPCIRVKGLRLRYNFGMPNTSIIPVDAIAKRITFIRGQRVMIDADLAELYGVSTKVFNQAVKRNKERFDDDFMFQLTQEESEILRSQIVTSSSGYGGRRYLPYVFTEHGA
jgi:hypothetical protein